MTRRKIVQPSSLSQINNVICKGAPQAVGFVLQMYYICLFVCLMVLNTTFNNISFISWRSVLLVDETAAPGENHRPVASH